MKKVLLLLCIIAGITTTSFAQLGKMQYEDAEEQFAAGKYKQAMELLDDAQASLGKSNPMIEHLRILSMTELAKRNPPNQFEIVSKARIAAADFLKKYNGNQQLEDKYREVYKASKTLRDLPTNSEEAIKTEELRQNEAYEQLRDFAVIQGYKDGMTVPELKANIPGYHLTFKEDTVYFLAYNNYKDITKISFKTGQSWAESRTLKTNNNTDKECSDCRRLFDSEVEKMTQLLGFAPSKSVKEGIEECKWTRGTKTIGLTITCQKYDRKMLGGVIMWSENIAFK